MKFRMKDPNSVFNDFSKFFMNFNSTKCSGEISNECFNFFKFVMKFCPA